MTIEARLAVATRLIGEAGDFAAGFFARRETLTRETKGPQGFISIAAREVAASNELPGPVMLARGGPLLASAPALFDRLAEVPAARLDLAAGS